MSDAALADRGRTGGVASVRRRAPAAARRPGYAAEPGRAADPLRVLLPGHAVRGPGAHPADDRAGGPDQRHAAPALPGDLRPGAARAGRASPCPGDRRATNAVLTEAGWDKIVQAAPGHVASGPRVRVDPLTPASWPSWAGCRAPAGPPRSRREGRRRAHPGLSAGAIHQVGRELGHGGLPDPCDRLGGRAAGLERQPPRPRRTPRRTAGPPASWPRPPGPRLICPSR